MDDVLYFNGIPIVFDEAIPPEDAFYIVSNSLDAKHEHLLRRIVQGVYETNKKGIK